MTLSEAARKWREERLRGEVAPKHATRRNERFAPLNAVVHGGWLRGMPSGEVRVWLVLHALAGGERRVRIGGATLGRLAGLNRTNALRQAAALARRGLVRVVERGRSGHGEARTANVYELLVPPPLVGNAEDAEEPD